MQLNLVRHGRQQGAIIDDLAASLQIVSKTVVGFRMGDPRTDELVSQFNTASRPQWLAVVKRKGQRLTVEVAAADNRPVIKDQWVVGGGIDVYFDNLSGMFQRVAAGSMNLGYAAQTVRVLNLPAIPAVFENLARFQQAADVPGHLVLPRMRPCRLDPRIKRLNASLECFQAHGCDDIGDGK